MRRRLEAERNRVADVEVADRLPGRFDLLASATMLRMA